MGRAGWLTIVATVATVATVALVSAYNRETGPVLAGGIGGLFVATAVIHYPAGASVIGFLLGDGGAGLAPAAALRAALSQLDLIIAAVSIPVLLARPRGDSPLLELDDTVTDAAAAIDDRVRSDFATSRAGTFGTFVLKSLDNGAQTATVVVVVVAVAAAGIIPGIINITGLGGSLRSLIVSVAGDSLVVLLLLTGVAAIIVGIGMPTTVMYIIITLLSPTLPEFGVAMIGAHLFVLYLGLMADVTPPVAVAAYAASGIAKSDAFETGRQAFLLSLNKIMVPFAFIFAPGIMLIRVDSVQDFAVLTASDVADLGYFLPEVVVPIVGMFAGVYALGPAIIGYYRTYVSSAQRVAFTVAALFLSVPGVLLMPAETIVGMVGIQVTLYTVPIDVAVRAVGAVLLAGLALKNRRQADEGVSGPTDPSAPAT